MPTYEVRVRRQRRSFLLRVPDDWATLTWGSMPLVLGLHDDGQTARQFYDAAEIERLMAGELSAIPPAVDPQKLVALFPQALSLSSSVGGEWNTGFSQSPIGLADVDDIAAIVACVEEAQRILEVEFATLQPLAAPPVGRFFDRLLILGFGTGGTLAYRCAIELPTRSTIWGQGALEPNCIAVAGCSSGGRIYSIDSPWPFVVPPPLAGAGAVLWEPAAGATSHTSVLHLQSTVDSRSSLLGGVSPVDRAHIDDVLGPGTAFYPWTERMGPIEATPGVPFDPTLGVFAVGVGPWVSALPGGPVATAVMWTNPVGVFARWTWDSSMVFVPQPGANAVGWAVSFLLWESDPLLRDFEGHYWPRDATDGFSGTREAWEFFGTYA